MLCALCHMRRACVNGPRLMSDALADAQSRGYASLALAAGRGLARLTAWQGSRA